MSRKNTDYESQIQSINEAERKVRFAETRLAKAKQELNEVLNSIENGLSEDVLDKFDVRPARGRGFRTYSTAARTSGPGCRFPGQASYHNGCIVYADFKDYAKVVRQEFTDDLNFHDEDLYRSLTVDMRNILGITRSVADGDNPDFDDKNVKRGEGGTFSGEDEDWKEIDFIVTAELLTHYILGHVDITVEFEEEEDLAKYGLALFAAAMVAKKFKLVGKKPEYPEGFSRSWFKPNGASKSIAGDPLFDSSKWQDYPAVEAGQEIVAEFAGRGGIERAVEQILFPDYMERIGRKHSKFGANKKYNKNGKLVSRSADEVAFDAYTEWQDSVSDEEAADIEKAFIAGARSKNKIATYEDWSTWVQANAGRDISTWDAFKLGRKLQK